MFAMVLAVVALRVNVTALNFIVGTAVPLLVALLAKWHAPANLKAILNLLLSAVGGALITLVAAGGATDDVWTWVLSIAMTWVSSIVSYYGLWKPTGTAPAIGTATAQVGVGNGVPR
jgi:hypothetical protein